MQKLISGSPDHYSDITVDAAQKEWALKHPHFYTKFVKADYLISVYEMNSSQ